MVLTECFHLFDFSNQLFVHLSAFRFIIIGLLIDELFKRMCYSSLTLLVGSAEPVGVRMNLNLEFVIEHHSRRPVEIYRSHATLLFIVAYPSQ